MPSSKAAGAIIAVLVAVIVVVIVFLVLRKKHDGPKPPIPTPPGPGPDPEPLPVSQLALGSTFAKNLPSAMLKAAPTPDGAVTVYAEPTSNNPIAFVAPKAKQDLASQYAAALKSDQSAGKLLWVKPSELGKIPVQLGLDRSGQLMVTPTTPMAGKTNAVIFANIAYQGDYAAINAAYCAAEDLTGPACGAKGTMAWNA